MDDRPVEADREAQSIGVEHTFDRDVTSRERLLLELPQITAEVAARLSQRGYVGRTVVLKLGYEDGRTVTRRRTWTHPLKEVGELAGAAEGLLTPDLLDGHRVRPLGVSVVNLLRQGRRDDG